MMKIVKKNREFNVDQNAKKQFRMTSFSNASTVELVITEKRRK